MPGPGSAPGRFLHAAHGQHAGAAEDFAAHVVAIHGLEVGLGGGNRTVVEADRDHGGVEEAFAFVFRGDQGVGHHVHFYRLGTGVEVAQGVEVVDQGFEEDHPLRRVGRVVQRRVAGQRAQQLRGADAAGEHVEVRGAKALGETPVEPDLQRHAGIGGGSDGAVGFIQGDGHGFFAEDPLAGAGGADHQFGVAAGRGGDQHAVDIRVVEQLLRVGVDLVHAQLRCQACGLAGGRVGDGGQAGAGDMPRSSQAVEAAHATSTDQAQADVLCTHAVTPSYCWPQDSPDGQGVGAKPVPIYKC